MKSAKRSGDEADSPGLGIALPPVLPGSVEAWKSLACGLLTEESRAFRRNVEISAWYAWIYQQAPAALKWTAMAAIASHHVRLAMFPLRLDVRPNGQIDLSNSLTRPGFLLTADVDTIRQTNNAIFDDIGWVHLAYLADDNGIERLRALLEGDEYHAQILASFELIDRGRRALEDPRLSARARLSGMDDVWLGNIGILEHEQRVVVQPAFDRLSCAFARIMSLGTASAFGVRGFRREIGYFTSFKGYSLTRGLPHVVRARSLPNIARFEERWRWLTSSVVPRFRRFESDRALVEASMGRVHADAIRFATAPDPAFTHPTQASAGVPVSHRRLSPYQTERPRSNATIDSSR